MKANDFSALIHQWFFSKKLVHVSLVEDLTPVCDPSDDYSVIYSVTFEPDSIDMAKVTLYLSDESYFGIGIETQERVSQRLGVKNPRAGYVAGFEPTLFYERDLFKLLECISSGRMRVFYFNYLLIRYFLAQFDEECTSIYVEKMKEFNPVSNGFLSKFVAAKNVLNYKHWS